MSLIKEAKKAYEGGMTISEIASVINVPAKTIYGWRNRGWRGNINRNKKNRRYTASEYVTAMDMVKSGKSQSEVGRLLGIDQSRISKWVRGVLPSGVTLDDIKREEHTVLNEEHTVLNNEDKDNQPPTVPLNVTGENARGDMETLDLFIDYMLRACQGYKEMKRQLKERTGQVQQKNTQLLDLTNRIQELLRP